MEGGAHGRAFGHRPSIEPHHLNSAGDAAPKAEAKRRKPIDQRPSIERANANFEDNFADRPVRPRGPDKIDRHIMFSAPRWPPIRSCACWIGRSGRRESPRLPFMAGDYSSTAKFQRRRSHRGPIDTKAPKTS